MSTHNIFLWRNKTHIMRIPPFELCRITRNNNNNNNNNNHLGLAKAGLNSGVVLFFSDLNSEISR